MTGPANGNGNAGGPRWAISFQPTVTLGGVIHLVVIVTAILGAWAELRAQVSAATDKMASIERKLEQTVGRAEFDSVTADLRSRTNALNWRVDGLVGRPPLDGAPRHP